MRSRICGLVVLLSFSAISASVMAESNRPGNPRGYTPDSLLEVFKLTQADSDVPFDTLMQACPARDCIPSIDQPTFVPVDEVDYLQDDDLVLTLTYKGISRAYPTRILDTHEIVNDMFGPDPVPVENFTGYYANMKAINPDIKILAYASPAAVRKVEFYTPGGVGIPDWNYRLITGSDGADQ